MANFNLDRLFEVGRSARAAVMRLRRAAEKVTILGPLPRLVGEVWGATWESTAAYHLEMTLLKEGLEEQAVIIQLSRALTRKMGEKKQGSRDVNSGSARTACIEPRGLPETFRLPSRMAAP